MEIKVELKFRDDQFARIYKTNLDRLNEKIQADTIKFIRFVQEAVVKPHTPVRTGRLRRSIDIHIDQRYKSQIIIRCYAGKKHPVPYAWYVEEGVDEHYIYPNKRYVLKFEGTHNFEGKTIFQHLVLHPGFAGYIMFQKGMIVIKTHLPKLLAEGIKSLPFYSEIGKYSGKGR